MFWMSETSLSIYAKYGFHVASKIAFLIFFQPSCNKMPPDLVCYESVGLDWGRGRGRASINCEYQLFVPLEVFFFLGLASTFSPIIKLLLLL